MRSQWPTCQRGRAAKITQGKVGATDMFERAAKTQGNMSTTLLQKRFGFWAEYLKQKSPRTLVAA